MAYRFCITYHKIIIGATLMGAGKPLQLTGDGQLKALGHPAYLVKEYKDF